MGVAHDGSYVEKLDDYRAEHGEFPENLALCPDFDGENYDTWGNPLEYERTPDGWRLTSLGQDGEPGGEGMCADLALTQRDDLPTWVSRIPCPPRHSWDVILRKEWFRSGVFWAIAVSITLGGVTFCELGKKTTLLSLVALAALVGASLVVSAFLLWMESIPSGH